MVSDPMKLPSRAITIARALVMLSGEISQLWSLNRCSVALEFQKTKQHRLFV